MIICPKCGKVETYSIKEYVHRKKLYHENDECYETTEDVVTRYDQPRCYECGSVVRFYIDPFENDGVEDCRLNSNSFEQIEI